MTESITGLANELNDLYDKLGTWDKVGAHYGVTRTVVWRIAKEGYDPQLPATRRKLGLPIVEMIAQVRNDKSGQFSKRSR